MFIVTIVVSALLAAILLVSAQGKLAHDPRQLKTMTHGGFPENRLWLLAAAETAGAAGLVIGLFWWPLGIAAAAGIIAYFLGATGRTCGCATGRSPPRSSCSSPAPPRWCYAGSQAEATPRLRRSRRTLVTLHSLKPGFPERTSDPTVPGTSPEPEGTRSVRMALRVLEGVADHQPAGVGQLSRALGLPKSSVQRALHTLGAAGWIQPASGGVTRWVLTERARHVGRLAGEETGVREAAKAAMEMLRRETGETVHLMVPDGDQAVLIERLQTSNPVRIVLPLGSSAPLHGSSNGKAMLAWMRPGAARAALGGTLPRYTDATIVDWELLEAELTQIRKRGYATNNGEWRADIAAVAAAILRGDGEPVASLSVSTPVSRMPAGAMATYGTLVAEAARQVSTALGYRSPVPG